MIYEKIVIYIKNGWLSTFQLILLRKLIEDLLLKRMEKNESIDTMVDETPKELKEIHERFLINGICRCPLCQALEKESK